ncbi:flavodoxin family protein [Bradyrhizobium sp. LHD-71]|uniref:flavodoxin family protein n=1 Tax=Bradyrhizobium sp. LHD-71 TaxID=3072141 RepID=UPI00280F5436|nr:flavodoxin family protein [Bradyrhizobium sp. LHD-71]MDQ8728129.1 flavodoxin family protein [Bradyrhizobium sp. LHD-71]
MPEIDVRKGMPPVELSREEFERRFRTRFQDPAFAAVEAEIAAVAAVAWDSYSNSRKSPRTRKAGPEFADPDYELSIDWLKARDAIAAAQARHDDPREKKRVLLVNGSSRSDQTCPGEISKSWRLMKIAEPIFTEAGHAVDILDLSLLASEAGRVIFPCKSCASTAMPLCHWPCSCYPNHALGQTGDWMNEIYPLWVAAHGIMIVTPVNWYQVPGGLKAMMDRLVCADGGNPDPTTTHGKHADEAKALELGGWYYPRHLAGRLFSVVVHGDVIGAETLRRSLSDWLTDMELISAGSMAELDGYVGYNEPYAVSHSALDEDDAFQQGVRNAATTLARGIKLQAEGKFRLADAGLKEPVEK